MTSLTCIDSMNKAWWRKQVFQSTSIHTTTLSLHNTHSGIRQWVELTVGLHCLCLSSTSSIYIYRREASLLYSADRLVNVGLTWGKHWGREDVWEIERSQKGLQETIAGERRERKWMISYNLSTSRKLLKMTKWENKCNGEFEICFWVITFT